MKNGAKETCNTCSISRIHLIKSTIANSDQIILSMFYIIKKQLTSNMHHCKIQLNNIVSRQEKEPVYRLGSGLLASYPILQILMYPASAHVIVVKEPLKLSYVSNWTATHVAY